MLQYTKFINVTHTARLELMLKKSKLNTGFLFFAPKMTDTLKSKFKDEALPSVFVRYQIHSSFLVNFWNGLMSLAIVSGVLVLTLLIEVTYTESQERGLQPENKIKSIRYIVQNFPTDSTL